MDDILRAHGQLVGRLDQNGKLPSTRRLEQLLDVCHSRLVHMSGSTINLGDRHHYRNLESQRNGEVLFRHAKYAHIRPNDLQIHSK